MGTSHPPDEGISFKEIKTEARQISTPDELTTEELSQTLETEYKSKKLQIEIDGQKQFLDLQKSWANHIKLQIWSVLLFQFLFVFVIGFNIWDFTDNLLKLPYMYVLVILQSLANIIALGFVVAKFLFPQLSNRN